VRGFRVESLQDRISATGDALFDTVRVVMQFDEDDEGEEDEDDGWDEGAGGEGDGEGDNNARRGTAGSSSSSGGGGGGGGGFRGSAGGRKGEGGSGEAGLPADLNSPSSSTALPPTDGGGAWAAGRGVVQRAADGVLHHTGTAPSVIRLRPRLGRDLRVLTVATERARHVLNGREEYTAEWAAGGTAARATAAAAWGGDEDEYAMVGGGTRARIDEGASVQPEEAQGNKRTATRCILRFRHQQRQVAALADKYRVRACGH
jgi:hypothetical protein